ncbi:MAG: ABC transporter permease [Trueperaceae bacterium]|nr:ABC transporter permease [Trueperaceae bacterium]
MVPSAPLRPLGSRPRVARLWTVVRALFARPTSGFGTAVVALFLLLAVFGPLLAPYGANEQVFAEARQPPSLARPFGTDHLGRDVFSRVLLGARDIVAVAGLGSLIAVSLGAVVGLATSYVGGAVEELTFRLFDALLAMPALLLALLLLGMLGPSRANVLIVLTLAYVPIVARVVRSVVLDVKAKDYVAAARLQGEPLAAVLRRDVLPAVLPALAVEAALRFSYAIFLVASLGFLGAGVQPPSPDWGLMIREARTFAALTPWALVAPAVAISLLVVAVNLMAEGLARALQVQRSPA